MGTWTTTAQALPGEDEAVEFTIGERCVPLRGSYRRGEFATRWWRYPAWTVNRWSVLERGQELVPRGMPSSASAFVGEPFAAAG